MDCIEELEGAHMPDVFAEKRGAATFIVAGYDAKLTMLAMLEQARPYLIEKYPILNKGELGLPNPDGSIPVELELSYQEATANGWKPGLTDEQKAHITGQVRSVLEIPEHFRVEYPPGSSGSKSSLRIESPYNPGEEDKAHLERIDAQLSEMRIRAYYNPEDKFSNNRVHTPYITQNLEALGLTMDDLRPSEPALEAFGVPLEETEVESGTIRQEVKGHIPARFMDDIPGHARYEALQEAAQVKPQALYNALIGEDGAWHGHDMPTEGDVPVSGISVQLAGDRVDINVTYQHPIPAHQREPVFGYPITASLTGADDGTRCSRGRGQATLSTTDPSAVQSAKEALADLMERAVDYGMDAQPQSPGLLDNNAASANQVQRCGR
jgi:hypothetical protein